MAYLYICHFPPLWLACPYCPEFGPVVWVGLLVSQSFACSESPFQTPQFFALGGRCGRCFATELYCLLVVGLRNRCLSPGIYGFWVIW